MPLRMKEFNFKSVKSIFKYNIKRKSALTNYKHLDSNQILIE